MGLTLVTSLAGDSMVKGLMSGIFGLNRGLRGVDARQRGGAVHVRISLPPRRRGLHQRGG